MTLSDNVSGPSVLEPEPIDFACHHCGGRFDVLDGDELNESLPILRLGRTLCDTCYRENVLAESHCLWCFDPFTRVGYDSATGAAILICRRCEP